MQDIQIDYKQNITRYLLVSWNVNKKSLLKACRNGYNHAYSYSCQEHYILFWEIRKNYIEVSTYSNSWACHWISIHASTCNGLFPPTDSDSDSDSKPYCYIVLCTTFSAGSDSDLDPCMDSFPNGYCTHFRDGSPSQGQISITII